MLQVYLVRHGETQWSIERRTQGQFDSPLTTKGEQQTVQAATRAKKLGITHIVSSDLGRTRRTAKVIAQAYGCNIVFDSRLRELNMGVLEKRHIGSPTREKRNWRQQLVNGTADGRIPEGESIQELSDRVNATLESCRDLPQGSRSLLMSYGTAPGCLMSTILGLPVWAERYLRLCNCSVSHVDYQENL